MPPPYASKHVLLVFGGVEGGVLSSLMTAFSLRSRGLRLFLDMAPSCWARPGADCLPCGLVVTPDGVLEAILGMVIGIGRVVGFGKSPWIVDVVCDVLVQW